jgi:hypothetical protein
MFPESGINPADSPYTYFHNDQQACIGVASYFHLVLYYEYTIKYEIRVMQD